MIRKSVRGCLALLQIFYFSYANADPIKGGIDIVLHAPPVGMIVESATRIARVKITAREPVHGDLLKWGPICGYVLSATVVEAFKGGAQPFKFLSTVPTDFKGFDRDYFVISFSSNVRSARDLGSLTELGSPNVVYQAACLLSQPNYVQARYQSLWSFDSAAEKRFGGEWLSGATRADGLFCGFDPRKFKQQVVQVRTVDTPSGYAINWPDVQKLIRTNLTKPESLSTCDL